ncbi:MAG: sulfite exporter TauE/SafE family protein [Actinobacteria bacterium]|nr:sulfite exporter TauE/SafE family protein [Actinomycetota bacterium]
MRILLASPLGFLIGVTLGAVGGGGSILAVPMLVYGAGLSPRKATTASLVIVGATALFGLPSQIRAHKVRAVAGIVFAAAGVVGSVIGTHVNRGIDPDVLLLAFSGLMVIAAVAMIRRERTAFRTIEILSEPEPDPGGGLAVHARVDGATILKVIVAGTIVGFLTGMFGVGGGFVIVPALVLALGFEMSVAAGTSLLVIVLNSGIALVQRYTGDAMPWDAIVEFLVMAIPGVLFGTWLGRRVSGPTLARAFVGLLLVVAAYTAIRSSLALFA